MNELRIFENSEFGSVRTLLLNGEPWFVGKDVAGALGYTNPQKAVRDHVDEEDKTVNTAFTVNGTAPILINETGMYSLILGSRLQNAKKFKRWVTSDVLPSIRKTGSYSANPKKARSVTDLACSLIACMEDNGDSPAITAKALGDIATHFDVPLSELIHAEPELHNVSKKLPTKKRHSLSVDEQQRYPALLEELKEIATVCNEYSYILPKDFNTFCEENSISIMVFRRWLYQNDFICGHYDKEKLQYTFSKWQDNHSIRIIKFK